MDHSAVDICSNIKSSFEVFEAYKNIREKVVKTMDTDPEKMNKTLWSNTSLIPIDNSCFNKMGERDNTCYSKGEKKFFSCAMCKIIGRLVDLTKHEKGKPFKIEVGEHEGDELIVKHSDMIIKSEGKYPGKIMVNKNKKIIYLVATDVFTNDILINWYLQEKLYYLPTILPMYAAFVCSKNTYSLHRNVEYGSLSEIPLEKLSVEVCRQILQQVVATFDAISEDKSFDFRYNIIDYTSLAFEFVKLSFEYGDYEYNHQVNLYFKDFDRSQILTKKGLYCNGLGISHVPLGKPKITYKKLNDSNVFSIRSSEYTTYFNDTHETFLLPESVDFYYVIVLLMSYEPFYSSVIKDEDLTIFWRNLWIPDQLELVNERMKLVREAERANITTHNLINVFDGLYLNEDIVKSSNFLLSI